MGKPKIQRWYSSEVHERAVRMAFDRVRKHPSLWAAISAIAAKKICCPTSTLLPGWASSSVTGACVLI